jgi:hypothetical protein
VVVAERPEEALAGGVQHTVVAELQEEALAGVALHKVVAGLREEALGGVALPMRMTTMIYLPEGGGL